MIETLRLAAVMLLLKALRLFRLMKLAEKLELTASKRGWGC